MSSDDEVPKPSRKKLKGQVSQPTDVPLLQSISISHPSDVLDMPVDPNEPTYCLCHQVSYGEMIGCDNPDQDNNFIAAARDSVIRIMLGMEVSQIAIVEPDCSCLDANRA
ncbi:hypothetical protein HPB51_009349 [Rhipicephalus microplus]|uniref:Uncharacterized protein n=1 Tax=Rhipicephalus microplus TaxID=6941 RepID=A0A9J6F108_RHIMP|nr:hypothetical protein HPB51_009349 [Rhipicephalus microplus]